MANSRTKGRLSDDDTAEQRVKKMQRKYQERARRLGISGAVVSVELFYHVVHDGTLPWAMRLRAAENLADRFGYPRMSSIENIGEDVSAPKLLITQHFPPPAGWTDKPPEFQVKKEPENGAPETNGSDAGGDHGGETNGDG